MLQTFEFTFQALASGKVRGYGAEALHGWLFHIWSEVNSEFATWLHDQESKPFALRGLRGKLAFRDGWGYLTEGEIYREQMVRLVDLFRQGSERSIRIGQIPMKWLGVQALHTPISYHELLERSFERDGISRLQVRFETPTSFRRQGVQLLFPEPQLMIESLMRRWEQYSPVPIPKEETAGISECMRVSQYDLSTSAISFDRYVIMGFRGEVHITVAKGVEPFVQGVVQALLSFAEYAGIGYKTTMGMGQVRVQTMKNGKQR
jgi:CRISPR-associated endoribonuclease Cas6